MSACTLILRALPPQKMHRNEIQTRITSQAHACEQKLAELERQIELAACKTLASSEHASLRSHKSTTTINTMVRIRGPGCRPRDAKVEWIASAKKRAVGSGDRSGQGPVAAGDAQRSSINRPAPRATRDATTGAA